MNKKAFFIIKIIRSSVFNENLKEVTFVYKVTQIVNTHTTGNWALIFLCLKSQKCLLNAGTLLRRGLGRR